MKTRKQAETAIVKRKYVKMALRCGMKAGCKQ